MSILKKVFASEIKAIDEKENTLTAYISTNTLDRMKEVLDPEGVDISNFKRNPVVLWAHNYEQPPIGKALWIKRDGNGILSKVKFATTEFAQEIFQLYKEGFLKAFSVGFIPKEIEDGDGEKTPRKTFKKWELLEYSAVPVPANPEALALAIQKGILKTDSLKESIEKGWEDEKIDIDNAEQKPKPGKDESKDDFLARCIPQLIDEGKDKDQAVAICHQLWRDKEKEANINPAVNSGLEELQAENNQLTEKVKALEKEINDLRYKIYQLSVIKNELAAPEITEDTLANKVVEIVNGVIRKAQGKVN